MSLRAVSAEMAAQGFLNERGAALPRMEANRPARDIADHLLRQEFVALKLGCLALFT